MLNIRRVLFTTDFSHGAARAFPRAVAFALEHDADLHILNVTDTGEETEQTFPISRPTLNDWLGTSSRSGGPDLNTLTLIQNQVEGEAPPEEIKKYVEQQEIDLVVMGTHGRRGAKRMLLGSVTEEVMRKSPCPVLTVRTDVEETSDQAVHRILAPVDFSKASKIAVRHATELARTYDAQLDLLHVVEQVVYPSAYGVDPGYLPTQEVLARVKKTLGDAAREEVGHENVQIGVKIGYAPFTILNYVKDNDVDLVVIATHGRTGFDRVLFGSVAKRVIRRSPVPVFVVKPNRTSLVHTADANAAEA